MDQPRRLQLEGNATLFGVRELSRTFKVTLAPVAFCLPPDKSAEYLSPETSMATLGFPPPSTFPSACLGGVWDPQGEKDHVQLMCFNLQHPGTKTILILSDFSKLCPCILFTHFLHY
ncbi:unnamed protein product [Pleuronectes platessa]|uniref:Uncharacterized protein n=1 Tax=Pleuronectes platessa TaxID=8262 RepID=A0A9N7TLK2_PLEPL|nr:unnamed protein product [Pleuronectes platessa]